MNTVAQIARSIRKDIKAAGIKASVRSKTYAGGASIHADVYGRDLVQLETVKKIINSYVVDRGSDPMTDSYAVNFFGIAQFI